MNTLHKILEGKSTGQDPYETGKRVGNVKPKSFKQIFKKRDLINKIKKRYWMKGKSISKFQMGLDNSKDKIDYESQVDNTQ